MVGTGKRIRGRKLLFPSDEVLEARRARLKSFPAIDTCSVLPAGHAYMEPTAIDIAVQGVLSQQIDRQGRKLLRALGCAENDWHQGFIELAKIHHNIGRLSHRVRTGRGAAATWSSDGEMLLLQEVARLERAGLSASKALKQLAKDRSYERFFPYREQRPGQRTAGSLSVGAREKSLKQKFYRLKREQRRGGLDASFGISSGYEMFLTRLDISHAESR